MVRGCSPVGAIAAEAGDTIVTAAFLQCLSPGEGCCLLSAAPPSSGHHPGPRKALDLKGELENKECVESLELPLRGCSFC